jgi:uncharacterized protein YutE (UPF0331/DUF86 family)
LKEELKRRLLRHLSFLEEELKDYSKFKKLTHHEYMSNIDKRRNVERWVENIINSSIDVSKVILTIEGKNIPDSYKEIVLSLSLIKGLKFNTAEPLSRWVRLRNIISHEYLDIRWFSIQKFILETKPLYDDLLEKAKSYLEKKITK